MDVEKDHTVVNVTEARQGNRRMMNTHVLVISTLAVVVALALIYLFLFNTVPPAGTPAG